MASLLVRVRLHRWSQKDEYIFQDIRDTCFSHFTLAVTCFVCDLSHHACRQDELCFVL